MVFQGANLRDSMHPRFEGGILDFMENFSTF